MSTPFSISSVLTYPPDDGKPPVDREAAGASSFDSKAEFDLTLTGSGTQVVDFGTIADGVKALSIEMAPDATNPTIAANININSGSDDIQMKPGGHMTYYNPSPSAGGIAAVSIVYTVPCRILIRALG